MELNPSATALVIGKKTEVEQAIEMAFEHAGHLLDFVEPASDHPGIPLFEKISLSFFEGFALPEAAEAFLNGPGSRSLQIGVFQSLEVRHAIFLEGSQG